MGLRRLACLSLLTGLAACASNGPPQRIVIPPGTGFRVAADSLAAHGIVKFPTAFRYFAALTERDRSIKAGTYEFSPDISWNDLLSALSSGRGLLLAVTIPEGWNLTRISEQLARALSVTADSVITAAKDSALRTELGVPASTVEGYLFPDTYLFAPGTTARQAVRAMVDRFEQAWKPEWSERLKALGRSRHDVMTMASIVETEARVGSERPVIAAVYYNRLKLGMKLQADPTVQYALGKHVERVLFRDLDIDSPYNTYRYAGLPPGPIASPGAPSMAAAVAPADVPYLYFVAHPDGHHEFRRTFAEHSAAIREVRAAAAKAQRDRAVR